MDKCMLTSGSIASAGFVLEQDKQGKEDSTGYRLELVDSNVVFGRQTDVFLLGTEGYSPA